jgi:hypothetical protein
VKLWLRRAPALLAVACLAPSSVALAADDQGHDTRRGVLAETRFESDADDFDTLLLRSGLLLDYSSHLHNSGVAVQATRYSQGNWSEDVPGIVGTYRNQKRDTLAGVRAEAGLVSVAGRARPVGDITWSLRPRESTGFELIAAGDVVGTREAIERSITYGLFAASAEQQFGQRLTGIALVGWQPFTDGNSRTLFRARMILSVLPEQGLSAQVRWRQYTSSDDDVTAYFSPDRYRNWDAGFSLRRRFGTWTVAGLAGAGQERIDNGSWQTTGIAELRGEGSLSGGKRLAVGLVYSNAAGFANSPDYWYGAVNASLIIPFGPVR